MNKLTQSRPPEMVDEFGLTTSFGELGDIDIYTGDDHPGNWGFKNGKLVFIDFSH